ncbi:YecA family protein [Carnobacterium divergens]|uniref:YecA family protein n=1 Tax=Carnobacterium divergens TaxID=2748 RepID=UPI0039B02579
MMHNTFIACDLCDENINLRIQMGDYDIPFNIHCPSCETSITGTVLLDNDSGMNIFEGKSILRLHNAHEVNTDDTINNIYSVELSAEFPTKKMNKRDMNIPDLTAFMRNISNRDLTYDAMKFITYHREYFNEIHTYFNLFFNNKNELLQTKLNKTLPRLPKITSFKEVNNRLESYMLLHQLLMTLAGTSYALEDNLLVSYSELGKKIGLNEKHEKIIEYLPIIKPRFDSIEKKVLELIGDFGNIYTQLIPVVVLRNSNGFQDLNKNEFGLMTANFEGLSDFYAKSYEFILNNIDIIIALNNIEERNSYNICKNGKSYDDISQIKSKIKRLELLDKNEVYSKNTTFLKNRIRNSIQHYDHSIDYISQEITFTDNYGGKTREEKLYLIDFGLLCLENFSLIIYIFELVYNLRKINFLTEGLYFHPNSLVTDESPAINNLKKSTKTNKKTGRNEPCPCGSGIKYKKCCGK